VQIKNVLKHDQNRVLHKNFRMQIYYLLLSDIKVISSTVADILAVT